MAWKGEDTRIHIGRRAERVGKFNIHSENDVGRSARRWS